MKLNLSPLWLRVILIFTLPTLAGCSLFPEARYRDALHNPFPQLKRVAVLPFFNQSESATLDTEQVASAYYAALQAVPGFEVLPIGVTKAQWHAYSMQFGEPTSGAEFQQLARFMNVEAIVVGSVTDFQAYYPPRMAMTVHWYAANEGFHEIPPGYGLPWGTEAEEEIPRRIVREAEFELAQSQLATQSPTTIAGQADHSGSTTTEGDVVSTDHVVMMDDQVITNGNTVLAAPIVGSGGWPVDEQAASGAIAIHDEFAGMDGYVVDARGGDPALPPDFPDPSNLIPDPPSPIRPVAVANHKPVLSQTRLYRGDDSYFTARLADYVETADDARGSGWQGYLKRSDDFVRFCCHLHVTEMLESRGGSDQSDLILRWPLSRY